MNISDLINVFISCYFKLDWIIYTNFNLSSIVMALLD